ncbi:GNAT family N-acetyltransferase [Roseivivax marinus]|uniref:GNAT family N-acetyltransferase n=1 Tax=Roseivivax marinus TaxID=1379903 RepID=UPI00273EA30C|nr:GNAT family protein [Roseivivax marinus]
MTIELCPLPPGRPDLLAAITLPPEQHEFASPPALSMAQADGPRDGHLIVEGDTPVGFFAIDRDYPRAHDFADHGSVGLRMFCIDGRHQGRGIAKAACRALHPYLARQYPEATAVYLTVNHRNPGARAAYLGGGFIDTGEDYLGGAAGPQHVMRLALQDAPAPA